MEHREEMGAAGPSTGPATTAIEGEQPQTLFELHPASDPGPAVHLSEPSIATTTKPLELHRTRSRPRIYTSSRDLNNCPDSNMSEGEKAHSTPRGRILKRCPYGFDCRLIQMLPSHADELDHSFSPTAEAMRSTTQTVKQSTYLATLPALSPSSTPYSSKSSTPLSSPPSLCSRSVSNTSLNTPRSPDARRLSQSSSKNWRSFRSRASSGKASVAQKAATVSFPLIILAEGGQSPTLLDRGRLALGHSLDGTASPPYLSHSSPELPNCVSVPRGRFRKPSV